jgi:NAD(P)-dependent dehydrogenase (short-subunit alcohol dehydrogenase family)
MTIARAVTLAARDAGAKVIAAGRDKDTLAAAYAGEPWDALGEQGKADYFADISARNPVGRIGTADDIANGVLFAMTSTFLTGQTLHIDGGEPLT